MSRKEEKPDDNGVGSGGIQIRNGVEPFCCFVVCKQHCPQFREFRVGRVEPVDPATRVCKIALTQTRSGLFLKAKRALQKTPSESITLDWDKSAYLLNCANALEKHQVGPIYAIKMTRQGPDNAFLFFRGVLELLRLDEALC